MATWINLQRFLIYYWMRKQCLKRYLYRKHGNIINLQTNIYNQCILTSFVQALCAQILCTSPQPTFVHFLIYRVRVMNHSIYFLQMDFLSWRSCWYFKASQHISLHVPLHKSTFELITAISYTYSAVTVQQASYQKLYLIMSCQHFWFIDHEIC